MIGIWYPLVLLKPKKLILKNDQFEYWLGKKMRFNSSWFEVTSILYVQSYSKKMGMKQKLNRYLIIKTKENELKLEEGAHFNEENIQRILDLLKKVKTNYPHIKTSLRKPS